jgi:hypothetical protein
VAFGDLMDPKPPTEPLMRSRLSQALRLARMTLFELDCYVMLYACSAHTHALTTMWRLRQPAAAVMLVQHALTTYLTTQAQELSREWQLPCSAACCLLGCLLCCLLCYFVCAVCFACVPGRRKMFFSMLCSVPGW